ncbi:uncharacterized protein I206_106427 [Kwoniella pini CBS 10737]|uniref:Uncharacterized protein n=1 Tax=Kwoniella pini CBS 10737 TaxID=1296096 RepID=A0A1B9HUA0_9TREE|nr:uncharacterized protein I206_07231 [Kwoniella pini CBS 10737]OCF46844.1 hypothetical protein I206_07231 [Kwoniella pini CBS 10737]
MGGTQELERKSRGESRDRTQNSRRGEDRHHLRTDHRDRDYDRRDRDRDGGRNREHDRSREQRTSRRDSYSRSRSRSRSPSRRHHKDGKDREDKKSKHRRRRSRSSSSTSSSSESHSETESEDERRRRRRKEKERRREKEDKDERRRRKEKKRAKKDKKRRGTASSTAQWGQYGLISEIDLPKKDSEFRAWLVEERKINPETVSKERTKKEFAIFVEDYNTATLPHDKYYDMAKFERKMNMIRSGQTLPDESGEYDPLADMKAHTSSLRTSAPKEKDTYLSKEKIAELRRVEAERTEIAKRRQMGLDVNKNLGVRMEDII